MKRLAIALLVACNASPPSSAAPGPGGPTEQAGPRAVRGLKVAARYPILASAVAFTADGRRWVASVERELLEYDGARVVGRLPLWVTPPESQLAPLPGGGWLVGAGLHDRTGALVWSAHQWAQRYGRFGSAKAFAFDPAGRVAIVDGADSPSTCLCDRERGTVGGSAGAVVRVTFVEGAVRERVLLEHPGRLELAVAASADWVVAVDGPTLTAWPARGDGPAETATLGPPVVKDLRWADDRHLVGTRYIDIDRTDVVVLDRLAGWKIVHQFPVAGMVRALTVRPGGAELAVAFDRYRATDQVWVDDRKVAVFALDGTRRAEVDLVGHPQSLAWSPRGDALLVATVGSNKGESEVVRYAVR